jgi:ribosomal protein L18
MKKKMSNSKIARIFIHKTSQHFYAQLIDKHGRVICAASTLMLRSRMKVAGESVNINFLNQRFVADLAKLFSEKIKDKNLESTVCFDRGKNLYAGLIAIFADKLRENDILI